MTDLDDLWRPSRWRQRVGAEPLPALTVLVLAGAAVWNPVANLALPHDGWVPANLAMTAVLLAVARRGGLSWAEMGLRRDRVGRGLLVGLVAAAIVATVLVIALVVPPLEGALEDADVADDSTLDRIWMPLGRIPLGTVVMEEVLFRGVLLALALRRFPVAGAVLATAAVFGLWHIVPAWSGGPGAVVGTVFVTAIAGVGFAWLRLRANSVVAPGTAHIATNSFAYLAALVALELV